MPTLLKIVISRGRQKPPNSFYVANIYLIPKSEKDTTREKKNYCPISLMNKNVKLLNKILLNQISNTLKEPNAMIK